MIEYASKAPSSHNTQPWKFSAEGHFLKITPDLTRALPVADSDNHELYISLGCALENLVIAASHFGYNANVMYDLNGEEDSVIIHLFEDEACSKNVLFDAIPHRHVNRSSYNREEIPFETMHQLIKVSEEDGVVVKIITDARSINDIGNLTKEACMHQYSNPGFKEELMKWVRFNESEAQQTGDGLRAASIGLPSVSPAFGKFMFQTFVTPAKEAGKAKRLIESSSALVLFICKKNNKKNWVKLGRSFERFTLAAATYEISHAHMNMPCEDVQVRKKLKQMFELYDEEPLLLIRIGYADETMPASYRRPVEEIITNETNG